MKVWISLKKYHDVTMNQTSTTGESEKVLRERK